MDRGPKSKLHEALQMVRNLHCDMRSEDRAHPCQGVLSVGLGGANLACKLCGDLSLADSPESFEAILTGCRGALEAHDNQALDGDPSCSCPPYASEQVSWARLALSTHVHACNTEDTPHRVGVLLMAASQLCAIIRELAPVAARCALGASSRCALGEQIAMAEIPLNDATDCVRRIEIRNAQKGDEGDGRVRDENGETPLERDLLDALYDASAAAAAAGFEDLSLDQGQCEISHVGHLVQTLLREVAEWKDEAERLVSIIREDGRDPYDVGFVYRDSEGERFYDVDNFQALRAERDDYRRRALAAEAMLAAGSGGRFICQDCGFADTHVDRKAFEGGAALPPCGVCKGALGMEGDA